MKTTNLLRLAATSLVSLAATLRYDLPFVQPRNRIECPSAETILKELKPLLSAQAEILIPSSPGWNKSSLRASSPRIQPQFQAVVEVASTKDNTPGRTDRDWLMRQTQIRYANRIGAPFLAVSGTHGWPLSLNTLKGGIQISLRKMNDSKVHPDGKTATVQGGTLQYEATKSLYSQGKKMAVTGLCECVSVAGPLLGGGHSMLQENHGFAADNLISAELVLANGSVVLVSSSENTDLFWAIRGAGHNFGIVTSMELKVYDAQDNWTMLTFVFTHDKLESYFSTWNQLESEYENVVGLPVVNGLFARNPDVDTANPVVILQVFFPGTNPIAGVYKQRFLALGPVVNVTTPDIEYVDLYTVGGLGMSSPVCREDNNLAGFPNSHAKWDPDAMRAGFNIFSELTADPTFNTSAWILESYGRHGVTAVAPSENAVAPEERQFHLLNSPLLWWVGNDEGDRKKAVEYGRRMQKAVGPKDRALFHAYVNYAVGTEALPEIYGRDSSRLARLERLKKTYDPLNRFGFYNPIV
ncbi:hypothetical protein QBC47DRAFT_301016 [Echria macrotheca]|uniref:FAD-binding PCMH-type domain-containing protein n=1 Tax=Echria macrotheca TaxID=438768 RepID=A0AAJ0BB80_9PEZI|nr:hypothetical protein QBC47DRAFT_301016 [Echria macrotheca]